MNPPNFQPAAAALSGPITVTLTWVPRYVGQPPPQAIIIDEQCSVTSAEQHSRQFGVTDTHSVNGFGDPEVTTQNAIFNGVTYNNLTVSKGRHYRTLPSQSDISPIYDTDNRTERPPLPATISWTVEPAAYADGFEKAYVGMEYIAQSHIVNILTTGTLDTFPPNIPPPELRKLVVGQGIKHLVSPFMSLDFDKPAFTTQHIRWTFDKKDGIIEPKEPFFKWTRGASSTTANVTSSLTKFPQDMRALTSLQPLVLEARRTYNPVNGNEMTSNADVSLLIGNEYFHWSLPNMSTVTPLFVDATLTIGKTTQSPGVDLKFKLSQKITVVRPDSVFTSAEGKVNIQGLPEIIANNGDTQYPIMAASILGDKIFNGIGYKGVTGVGERWVGSVRDPLEFEVYPKVNGEVIGYWNFVQIIKPNRSIRDQNGADRDWSLNDANFQLDVMFPYMQNPFDIYETTMPVPAWKAYADSIQHTSNDSPYLTLATANNVRYQEGRMHDQFQVLQMYLPPNTFSIDVEWVPLQYLEWHTDGDSTIMDITTQTYVDGGNNVILCLLNHLLTDGVTRPIQPTVTAGHPIWQKIVSPGINDVFILR